VLILKSSLARNLCQHYINQLLGLNQLIDILCVVNYEPVSQTRLIWMLRRAFHAVEAEKGVRLQPVGLRAAHYSLMINVAERPGLSGAALARRMSVAPQNVAALASRLERQGLLERRAHPRHGHVQELYLTPAGESLISLADEVVAGLEADIVAMLGSTDARRLRRMLADIADRFPSAPGSPLDGDRTAVSPD
jgi:DNA-binding MarR family transcriptional regulator